MTAATKAGVGAGAVLSWAAVAVVGAGLIFGGWTLATNAPGAIGAKATAQEQEQAEAERADEAETNQVIAEDIKERAAEKEVQAEKDAEAAKEAEQTATEEKAVPEDTVHRVTDGETLSSISAETGISVDRLAVHNGIVDVDVIYADSALRVPYIMIPVE